MRFLARMFVFEQGFDGKVTVREVRGTTKRSRFVMIRDTSFHSTFFRSNIFTMGCNQSKANDVEPPNKCERVAADRPRESAAVSVESRKVPRQAAETNQAPDSHPREHASKDKHEEAVCHQSSSASISDALDKIPGY